MRDLEIMKFNLIVVKKLHLELCSTKLKIHYYFHWQLIAAQNLSIIFLKDFKNGLQ